MPRRPPMLRSSSAHALAAWLLVSLVVGPLGGPALAGPQGEKVVRGSATFSREGDLTIIRPSNGAIISYRGFDIAGHEAVRFEQPSAKARVLNRVSGDPTRIDGKLSANGIVYLVNPSGVFFGRTAIVDVKRLVAAAGDLPDRKFLRQRDAFALSGPVENLGSLEADAVSLLGRSVRNAGTIVAPKGTIALVAGEKIVLTRLEGGIAIEVEGPPQGAGTGVEQSGLVDAAGGSARFAVGDHYSLAINHSGVTRARDIALTGGDGGLVKVAGALDASAPEPGQQGGSVRVTGELVHLEGATLDASGSAGGGEIRVGGDARGAGPLRNARRTFVDADSRLRADALESGDGGSAVVYGEEAAAFHGTISARGGAAGGDGGFAELSSNGALTDEGQVDLRAPAGAAGTLLYDPRDIEIVGGTQDGGDTPNTSPDALSQGGTAGQVLFAASGENDAEPFQIFESELEGTDANIVLEARNSIVVAAGTTFDHDANGEGAGVVLIRPDRDLTLRTRNDPTDQSGSTEAPGIRLTGSTHGADLEFRTSGEGEIVMVTSAGDVAGGPEAGIEAGVLRSESARVALATEDGGITVHSITTSGKDGATGGNAGNIILDAGDDNADGDTAILVTGDLTARGGNATTGAGGNGGGVGLQTRQKTATTGGGSLTVVGAIDTRGGDTTGTTAASLGGDGGQLELNTVDGNLSVGSVDTRGGTTAGGEAIGGGSGGSVAINTFRHGDISVGDIDTRGADALSPTLASTGGDGGVVNIRSGRTLSGMTRPFDVGGDIAVGNIDTSGGATDGTQTEVRQIDGEDVVVPLEFGGSGGAVTIFAAVDGQPGDGGITLNGNMVLLGGDNGTGPSDGDGFGGNAELRAIDAIETAGQAGPHITVRAAERCLPNCGSVVFNGSDVGAINPIRVRGADEGLLGLGADDVARVDIEPGNFDDLQIVAFSGTADVQLTEAGTEIVRIQNSHVVRGDTGENKADLVLGLQDRVSGMDDAPTPLVLTIDTGSIEGGGDVRVLSEDDIVVGNGGGTVAVMNALPPDPDNPPEPGDPTVSGVLALIADSDEDEKGGIRAGGGALDLRGSADEAGGLLAIASDGIGEAGNPLVTTRGGPIAMLNGDTSPPVNGGSGGIYVRNDDSGDLTVAAILVQAKRPNQNLFLDGVSVVDGPGDVSLENTAGNLVIEESVNTSGGEAPNHLGGAITLAAAPGSSIVLAAAPQFVAANANRDLTFESDVTLKADAIVRSRLGNIAFEGAIDTDDSETAGRVHSLGASARHLGEDGAEDTLGEIRLAGDVGAARDLRGLVLDGDVVLEGGTRNVHTTNVLLITGDVRANAQDAAGLAILAGPRVEFRGDIGAAADGRLSSFSVAHNDAPPFAEPLPDPLVSFDGEGAQQVVTGAGGIAFTPGGLQEIPDRAMVAKRGGDLRLESQGGSIEFGQNQKLSVQGDANLVAPAGTVRVGDVSALELHVASSDIRVLAREPGRVLVESGGHVTDDGTDIVANVVDLQSAPVVEGTGPAPRIGTSHAVANPGSLEVVDLLGDLEPGDLVKGGKVLDLVILPPSLPNETPQQGPEVGGLITPRTSGEAAGGSALPPAAEETLAYLRCTAAGRDGCDVVPDSPLDSPRGVELAADAARLLGDSAEARDLRGALGRLDPAALRELAVFLTEIRLLGLSESEYQAVRDSLYREILAQHGPGAPDAQVFAQAVEAQSRGVPL